YLQEHRDWIDKVCAELKITPIIPLWDKDTSELISEFIKKGFKAIIVSTRSDMLGSEWLGREIDTEFAREIKSKGNIDLCGERGEFHTFVYDGPFFKNPLQFSLGNKALKGNRWYLEVFS
ncbi:ATP pyrophosphatase, partial [bacterium]